MEMIDSHGDMVMRQINVTVSYTLTDPTVNKSDAFSITFFVSTQIRHLTVQSDLSYLN